VSSIVRRDFGFDDLNFIIPLEQKVKKNALSLLKNIGVSIGAGIFGCFIGDQTVVLSAKIGVIPDFNWSQMMTEMCVTSRKIENVLFEFCFLGPVFEELMHRGGVQEILLTGLPKNILKIIAPGKETLLDLTVVKTARIFLTAAFFSYVHFLLNRGVFPDSYCNAQIVSSFVKSGITYGLLKESKIGLLGSIVAHISNNILSLNEVFSYC
jgi:hypothetical protein